MFWALAGASLAVAAPPTIPAAVVSTQPQEVVAPGGRSNVVQVRVLSAAATSSEELETAAAWARRDLENARAENPGVHAERISVEPEDRREGAAGAVAPNVRELERVLERAAPGAAFESQSLPDEAARNLRQRFDGWFERNYRVTLTIVRGLLNGTVVTWSLVVSKSLPLEAALPVGVVCGAMSAGYQYFNKQFQNWLLAARTIPGQTARHLSADLSYLAAARGVGILSKAVAPEGLFSTVGSVLRTGVLGWLAQGPWELGLARDKARKLRLNPTGESSLQRWSDLKVLALSSTATAIQVMTVLGVRAAEAGLYALGVTGGAYFLYSYWRDRKAERVRPPDPGTVCERHLRP